MDKDKDMQLNEELNEQQQHANCESEDVCDIENSEQALIAENESLIKKLEESEKQAEEYKQSWYRTAADFDNFRKRNNETRAIAYADGQCDVIKAILPIGDNLDRALASCKDEQTKAGMELVVKQFGEILKNIGVEEINPVGEPFDPNVHEAVHQVEGDAEDESGTIKSVFRKGYSLNGKMMRYAQVVVVK